MADFNFNIKLGVDDSEVMKSIRRLDAESKRVASGSSKQVAAAPPVQQNLGRVPQNNPRDAGRIAAADAQVQKRQAQALGLDAPSLNKMRTASVESFKASMKGFDFLPKSEQRALLSNFKKSFDSFFLSFDRELKKINPARISSAVKNLYDREVGSVLGKKAVPAAITSPKAIIQRAETVKTANKPNTFQRAIAGEVSMAETVRAKKGANLVQRPRKLRGVRGYRFGGMEEYQGDALELLDGVPVAELTMAGPNRNMTGGLDFDTRGPLSGRQRRKLNKSIRRQRQAIRVKPSDLQEISKSKRYRSAVGSAAGDDSLGVEYDYARLQYEDSILGVPQNVPQNQKPVYGYLDNKFSRMNTAGYGASVLFPKRRVRKRSTLSFGDSLSGSRYYGGDTADPEVSPLRFRDLRRASSLRIKYATAQSSGRKYAETQIYGGLNLKDLKKRIDIGSAFGNVSKDLNTSLPTYGNINPNLSAYQDIANFAKQNKFRVRASGAPTGMSNKDYAEWIKNQRKQGLKIRDSVVAASGLDRARIFAANTGQKVRDAVSERLSRRDQTGAIQLGNLKLRTGESLIDGEVLTGKKRKKALDKADRAYKAELVARRAAGIEDTFGYIPEGKKLSPEDYAVSNYGPLRPKPVTETPVSIRPRPKPSVTPVTIRPRPKPEPAPMDWAALRGQVSPLSKVAQVGPMDWSALRGQVKPPAAAVPVPAPAKPVATTTSKSAANIAASENNLVKSINDKSKSVSKQSDLIKNIYPNFSKAERGLVSSLNNKSKAVDRQTNLLKTVYADFSKAERTLISAINNAAKTLTASASKAASSTAATAKTSAAAASAASAAKPASSGRKTVDPFGDDEEEKKSPYEAAAEAAAQRKASMEDIGEGVRDGGGINDQLIQDSGVAEAYGQYINALIEAAAALERENLGLVKEIAEAKAQAALYNQKLANQVLSLQNADPAFIAGAAQGQVLKAQQAAAVGAAAQANYGPQLAAAGVTSALTRREAALAKLRAGVAAGVDPALVGTRGNRILLARQAVQGTLARGDEQAIAAERKRQVAQIREGVKSAVQLDPKEALAALREIQKQLSTLQNDIADDVDITINDAAATAVLQKLGKETDALQKKIADLQNIGQTAPQNLATALDAPKDTTSKDLRDLKRRAKLIGSNVKDATALYDTDPKASRQALRSSEAAIKDLKKERKQLANSVGGVKNFTSQQKAEYDSLTLAIKKVVEAQKQLNNPNTINAASRAAKLRAEIRKEQTLLGEISKEKDPAKRAAQLKDLDDRVKKLAAQKLNIDTSVDPQAQIELDRLDTQIGILNSKRIAVASGAVVGGGGGAGGGGGRVAGAAGAAGRGGQRGDIVSRVRGLGGAAGFFGSGALSTLRYSIPSAILFGAATGITSSIKEAEQLQFNLAKIEGQIRSTFGDDAEVVTQQFKQQIMDISLETGLAADELALLTVQLIGAFSNIGTIEGMSGIDLVNSQIESAAKIAQSTGLPLAEITDGLTAASIAFGASFQKIGDVALGLEQKSGVLAKETISFIGDIAPVATEAGFSLEEFSAIAVIAQQRSGRGGAALAEQFGRIIPAVYQSRQALLDIAVTNSALGTPEFFTAINNSDTRGILFGIGKAFNSLNKESKDFIVNLLGGRREAAAILPALSNPQALQGLTDAANNSAGKLEERFKKVQATLTNTFQRLNEQVRKLFLTLLESGLEDLLKEIAGLLGIIAKGFGLVFNALSPVLGALDGLPIKILAAVAAFKLLRAATKIGPGGGIAGLIGRQANSATSIMGAISARRLQGQAAAGTISPAQRAQAAAVFNAMAGYGLPGYNVKPYGLNPKTGRYSAPGMLGSNNINPSARAAFGAAGGGRAGLAAGLAQGARNTFVAARAGAGLTGGFAAGASALFGGPVGLALTGLIAGYSVIKSGVDEQNANLEKIKEFANDANTSIGELRKRAQELREETGGISIGSKIAGFFTGKTYLSEADYADELVRIKEQFTDNEQKIIEILTGQQEAITFFLERQGGITGKDSLPLFIADRNIQNTGVDFLGDTLGNVPGVSDAGGDSRRAANAAMIKSGRNKGKFDVKKYIREAYKGEGKLGESDIFDADKELAEAGDPLRTAAIERLTAIAEGLGISLNNISGDVAVALTASSNPVKALEKIAKDPENPASKEAGRILKIITERGQDDPRVKALLEANGLINDAVAATLKSAEQLQKDLDLGRVAPETYVSGLDQLIQSTLTAISQSTGNQKVLYESLLNLLKLRNDFINSQAQQTLTSVLDVLNVTTDTTTVSSIAQKAAAIQAAINSGLTGEDLRKAALDLVQTQQDMVVAMILNADTAEQAAEIASAPIKIPLETRVAAIKGRLGALVGNWSTFTQGWEFAFGETADGFISFITAAVANGSMSIDQVRAMLEQRKKQLEQQKQAYLLSRTFIGARDASGNLVPDQTSQAIDQAIAGTNAMIGSIDATGGLPGDPGAEVRNRRAIFQANQQRSQAQTNLNKAKANKDSVAKAMMDAQQAENDYQKAVADDLDETTLADLDTKRREAKQAVVDAAKAVADAVRGIAKAQAAANKDSVAQAVLDLNQANVDYLAAVAAQDKEGAANAQAAQIAARAAIRDAVNNRAKTFAQLLKALGSQDSLDQAQYDVNIARMNMANAVGPEERMQAWMELIAAERAQREAFKRRREAMFDLAKAQTEDPVQDAQYDLTLAQQLIAEAKTNDERIAAQKQLIDAQRAMTNAMNDVRNSQFTLRQAELAAIGDDIGAAQVAAAAAREQLAQAINAGKGAAEINNLRAGVISAEKAARDAIFQGKLDEYKYLLDTDQITKTEYANYLEGLKSTLIPGTKQFKDLEVTIKNLKDDISGNLQTNLPTSLMLPTLYEVRRLNQSGQFGNVSGGANGPSVGYQDNRNIQVQVVVNNGMSESQVVDSLAKAMNVGTSGLESRRY